MVNRQWRSLRPTWPSMPGSAPRSLARTRRQVLGQTSGGRPLRYAGQLGPAHAHVQVAVHVVDRRQRTILGLHPLDVSLQVADLVLQPLHLGFQPTVTVGYVVAAGPGRYENTSVLIASDTDRARVHRRTCSTLCRPRNRPAAASASAAVTAKAIEVGKLTALISLPASARAAAATGRPSRSPCNRCGPAFRLSAVCDHMLCRRHAHPTAWITGAVTRVSSRTESWKPSSPSSSQHTGRLSR